MWEAHLLLTRNTKSLAKDAGPLDQNKRDNLKNWLAALDFELLPSPKRKDFEACRSALLEFVDAPAGDSFKRGDQTGELSWSFMPLLVAFEVDARKARDNEYPEVAESIDALSNLAKGLLSVSQERRSESKTVSATARFFVDYFGIYHSMFKAKKRPVLAQAALLAMRPSELTNAAERSRFKQLHDALVLLSRSVTSRDSDLGINEVRPLAIFTRILSDLDIPDEQIIKAGGKKWIDTIQAMREFSKEGAEGSSARP